MDEALSYESRLAPALAEVRQGIERACERVGRDPKEVRIVAVTKGHGEGAIEAALAAGLRDLGENRIGALGERVPRFADHGELRWHMVGHLQSRKAPQVHGLVRLLHSLDSLRLGERLDRSRPDAADPLPVLVQVNTSGEEAKYGFTPDAFRRELPELLALGGLRIEGLMTMAPFTADEGVVRTTFRRLKELHEEALQGDSGYAGRELSMGMSNDWEIAVEEGSTLLRLGTVLFGERPE